MSMAERAAERTLDEVKAEVMRRAGAFHPFEGLNPADAQRVMDALTSLDGDHWAEQWSRVGREYEDRADAAASAGTDGHELAELYMLAFDYYRTGRYPTVSTPGKKEAYRHSVRAFRKAAAGFDVPLEIVEIPFGDQQLVGYLQKPTGVEHPPVVIQWGGVDGWKEDRTAQAALLMEHGMASLAVDMPGTGENPVLWSDPDAEATYVAWLDHVASRTDIDGSRVGVWGGSFGGYWAARLAHTQSDRIGGAVFHGGNAHFGFQREWLVPAFTTGGETYLFGAASLLEARGQATGWRAMDEFIDSIGRFSLLTMGLLDGPSAPILAINGKRDDQAPIADVYLLLEHGNPKEARVYPEGRHMGRTSGMPEREVWTTIAVWLRRKLAD
jgi:esterase FrsA